MWVWPRAWHCGAVRGWTPGRVRLCRNACSAVHPQHTTRRPHRQKTCSASVTLCGRLPRAEEAVATLAHCSHYKTCTFGEPHSFLDLHLRVGYYWFRRALAATVVLGASLLSTQPAMGLAYGEIEVLDVSAPPPHPHLPSLHPALSALAFSPATTLPRDGRATESSASSGLCQRLC